MSVLIYFIPICFQIMSVQNTTKCFQIMSVQYQLLQYIMSVLICLNSIVLPGTSRAGSSARGAFASVAFA